MRKEYTGPLCGMVELYAREAVLVAGSLEKMKVEYDDWD